MALLLQRLLAPIQSARREDDGTDAAARMLLALLLESIDEPSTAASYLVNVLQEVCMGKWRGRCTCMYV